MKKPTPEQVAEARAYLKSERERAPVAFYFFDKAGVPWRYHPTEGQRKATPEEVAASVGKPA